MRKTAVTLVLGAIALSQVYAQALRQPGRALSTAEPRPYINLGADRLRATVRQSLPSRRMAAQPGREHVLPGLSADERATFYAASDRAGRPYLQRVGVHRQAGADLRFAGQWQSTEQGERVYRFTLRSTGAHGVRVHFQNFHVGRGRVWIHDGSGQDSEVFGPWSGDGLWNNGDFWSDYVLSDRVTIEFQPGPDARAGDALPFEVREISHLAYLDAVLPRPMSELPERFNAVACHLDASCYDEWQQSARGIARMLFEVEGGAAYCTGTLLATRTPSDIPYFLTADHCISDEAQARSLQAFWFYQTATCNGPAPDPQSVPRTLGAAYLGGVPFERGDGTLLRLREIPNGAVFQGWTAETIELNGTATGIHHPAGSHRRITFGSLSQPVAYTGIDPATFIGLTLDGGGLTQPGSSGSALFARPGVVIGQLSHGPRMDLSEYCSRLPFPVSYGRFSLLYAAMRQYLDGDAGAPAPPPGGTNRVLESGVPIDLTMPSVESPTLFSNVFEIAAPAGSTRLEIKLTAPESAIVAVAARHGQVPMVDAGQIFADSVQTGFGTQTIVLAPPRVGTYFIRVGLRSPGMEVPIQLTATLSRGSGSETGGRRLNSGQAIAIDLPAVETPTLFNGAAGYRIDVPAGAARLDVSLSSSSLTDVDLFVRRAQDVGVDGSYVVADERSMELDSNERVVISEANLQPGTYYIALVQWTTGTLARVTLTATITESSPSQPTVLTPGQPARFYLPAVDGPTLFTGNYSFAIDVPQGANRLQINLASDTQDVDTDLYVRYEEQPVVSDGNVVADHVAGSFFANETLLITPQSFPSLRPGRYWISIASFTTGAPASGTITATVSRSVFSETQSENISRLTPAEVLAVPAQAEQPKQQIRRQVSK